MAMRCGHRQHWTLDRNVGTRGWPRNKENGMKKDSKRPVRMLFNRRNNDLADARLRTVDELEVPSAAVLIRRIGIDSTDGY